MTVINEERNNRELTESIRKMKIQRNNTKKINLTEEDEKISVDEIIINNISFQVQKMSSYCLKWKKKNTENINPRVWKTSNVSQYNTFHKEL